ncbi:protocatechuate 3,4-dioxygenase subunit alpha [Pseudonocardia sp. H11422]|uniref:protocatechuate 3,4-dioxygenase subunit alpha n=1 Tax=Pseudonocardia sp. H11422 TaxID=2835866 RepID=UPI001BDD1188|nr:protocatechuate 3,4-dioxygenase subunit alpha [Pseudonocardia sp. H11422]
MSEFGLTPSQTVGPFLSIGLTWADGPDVVPAGTPGEISIGGVLYDGAGEPVTDGLVETWQADPDGRFDHPEDPRGAAEPSLPGFRGFGRAATDGEGRWEIRTVKPGALPGQAPHIDVSVFARGLLDRVVTRIYFPDEEAANALDPLLAEVPADRAATLVARPDGPGALRFDIRLQGESETVFLAV